MPEPILVTGPMGRMLARTAAGGRRDPDVMALGEVWQRTVERTVERLRAEVGAAQHASLLRQVSGMVDDRMPSVLGSLQVPDLGAGRIVEDGMRDMAAAGAEAVVSEAARQGATINTPPPLAALGLGEWARAAADLIGAGLALGAGREALRLWRPGVATQAIVEGVRGYLAGLTDRGPREVVGGALTRAQNLGRMSAYRQPSSSWVVRLVADETLDANTCEPCREIDGTVLPTPEAAELAYGGAGYLFCKGRERCRGTMRGEWLPRDQAEHDAWRSTVEMFSKIPVAYSGDSGPVAGERKVP